MKKNILFYCVVCFLFVGCSNPYSKHLFLQQQNRSVKDDGNSGGVVGGWDEEDSDFGSMDPDEDGSSSGGTGTGAVSWNMFAVLQPNGEIIESCYGENAAFNAAGLEALKAKLAGGTDAEGKYLTSQFDIWGIRSTFSGSNVPTFSFVSGVTWSSGDSTRSEWRYGGPNSSAGSNSITNVTYLKYKGKNPLFSADNAYNTATYKKKDGSTETIMNRFDFYRFTGKGGGVAELDNMLVAIDTYTKLIFAFAKPTKSEPLLGQQVPREWGPVDLVSTGPGGKKYKFYEYDPAGFVKSDGSVILYKWYLDGMGRGSYDPVYTGISPYVGRAVSLVIDENGNIVGGGDSDSENYAVSGNLIVKAKYIRNDSVTDAWGDHGNSDSTDSPEFVFDVRARAYEGFTVSDWESLSSFKPADTGIMPANALFIKKGETRSLSGSLLKSFEKVQGDLTVELDSRIVEIDISGNDWICEYEKPVVYLIYDRYTQKWKLNSNNNTFMNGPVWVEPSSFSVGYGEEKDLIIVLPAGGGQTMSLCYTISWQKNAANENEKKIVSAELINQTPLMAGFTENDYLVTFNQNETGVYSVNIDEFTQQHAMVEVPVILDLFLGNLDASPTRYVEVTQVTGNTSIKNIFLNGNPVSTACYGTQNLVRITFNVASDPTVKQEAKLELNLTYKGDGYDTSYSPKKITLNITRGRFVPVQKGLFTVSNARIKNLSLRDVGGDAGDADGYDDPEFFWHIRTRKNAENWNQYSFMAESNDKRISVGKTYSVGGRQSYEFTQTDTGVQRVYIDMELTERDRLASNGHDPVSKFGQPTVFFEYNRILDEWFYRGDTSKFFYTSADNRWELKKVEHSVIKKNSNIQTVVLTFSSYVADTIWPSGNIADFINGPKPAGWGDMEVSFDIEWIAY